MNIDLSNIINSEGSKIAFDEVLNLPNLPLKDGAKITGYATNFAGRVEVYADIDCVLLTQCSRCATDIEVPMAISVKEVVGEDDFNLNGALMDISELTEKNIFLNIKMQYLCREDCKGLCAHCGTNLNEKSCDCKEDHIDERFAKLAELLKKDD